MSHSTVKDAKRDEGTEHYPHPTPFPLQLHPNDIASLRARLASARLPNSQPSTNPSTWQYGADPTSIDKVLRYWEHSFNWAKEEADINAQFDMFMLSIEDVNIHYIHQTSTVRNAAPLMLIHGWPSSFLEFSDVIPRLTSSTQEEDDNAMAFHVVAPSIPGFLLSTLPRTDCSQLSTPISIFRIATYFHLLLQRLGYENYYVHGTDWGSLIARAMAILYPDACQGIHITFPVFGPPRWYQPVRWAQFLFGWLKPDWVYSPEEAEFIREIRGGKTIEEVGYLILQATRPMTLATALADSPTGWMTWMFEKMVSWTDGSLPSIAGDMLVLDPSSERGIPIPLDAICRTATLYWTTNTIHTSFYLYHAMLHSFSDMYRCFFNPSHCKVPLGVTVFRKEFARSPKSWAEARWNLVWWKWHASGGHFPAVEVPDVLVQEIRGCFHAIRQGDRTEQVDSHRE